MSENFEKQKFDRISKILAEEDSRVQKIYQEIGENHRKIIDDWCKAYLAELYQEGIEIKPGCFTLVEQIPIYNSNEKKMLKKYWFEKNKESKSNWISSSVQPPRKDITIAIVTKDCQVPQSVTWNEKTRCYEDDTGTYYIYEYDILFWIPLPPAPLPKRDNHTCLPKDLKGNEIVCQNTDYGLEILLPDRMRFPVQFCPFCGEKA